MYCTNCGKENEAAEKFRSGCGCKSGDSIDFESVSEKAKETIGLVRNKVKEVDKTDIKRLTKDLILRDRIVYSVVGFLLILMSFMNSPFGRFTIRTHGNFVNQQMTDTPMSVVIRNYARSWFCVHFSSCIMFISCTCSCYNCKWILMTGGEIYAL